MLALNELFYTTIANLYYNENSNLHKLTLTGYDDTSKLHLSSSIPILYTPNIPISFGIIVQNDVLLV